MALLLPRLPLLAAERLLDDILDAEHLANAVFDPHNLPETIQFAPTGGVRATPAQLQTIRDAIYESAKDCGHNRKRISREYARFDNNIAAWTIECGLFSNGEALRDDVWAFVATVIAPDVVKWRFGNGRKRYLGGVRNTFQRLWLRGHALDRGPDSGDRWGLTNALTEDAFVQIIERPSIGASPLLARAIAEAWVRASTKFKKTKMESIMRRATLSIRIHNEIRSLSSLDQDELHQYLDSVFEDAAGHVLSG